MGKYVDQVYFVEKWTERKGLKIVVSQQFSNMNFSIIIFSLSVGNIISTYIHILIPSAYFQTLTVLSAFSFTTCVMVQ